MAVYSFRCKRGHAFEIKRPIGSDLSGTVCECGKPAERDLGADLASMSVRCDDIWRKHFLSSRTAAEYQKQGRAPLEGTPRDKFEKRDIEKATGRIYIGDDISALKPERQKSLERQYGKRV